MTMRESGDGDRIDESVIARPVPDIIRALEAIYDGDVSLGDYYLASSPFLRSVGVVSTDLDDCMDYLEGDDG